MKPIFIVAILLLAIILPVSCANIAKYGFYKSSCSESITYMEQYADLDNSTCTGYSCTTTNSSGVVSYSNLECVSSFPTSVSPGRVLALTYSDSSCSTISSAVQYTNSICVNTWNGSVKATCSSIISYTGANCTGDATTNSIISFVNNNACSNKQRYLCGSAVKSGNSIVMVIGVLIAFLMM